MMCTSAFLFLEFAQERGVVQVIVQSFEVAANAAEYNLELGY